MRKGLSPPSAIPRNMAIPRLVAPTAMSRCNRASRRPGGVTGPFVSLRRRTITGRMPEASRDDWISVPVAARLLGLQLHTVYRLIENGELGASRPSDFASTAVLGVGVHSGSAGRTWTSTSIEPGSDPASCDTYTWRAHSSQKAVATEIQVVTRHRSRASPIEGPSRGSCGLVFGSSGRKRALSTLHENVKAWRRVDRCRASLRLSCRRIRRRSAPARCSARLTSDARSPLCCGASPATRQMSGQWSSTSWRTRLVATLKAR